MFGLLRRVEPSWSGYGETMIGSDDDWWSYWGYTGEGFHDMLPAIISRAVKAGFYVVLLQPGSETPACFATDMAIKRGHQCSNLLVDTLEPQERAQKVRPMVTAAIQRVTERYGGTPNVAIDLLRGDWAAKVLEPAGVQRLHSSQSGGIRAVPPSVIGGVPVTVETAFRDLVR